MSLEHSLARQGRSERAGDGDYWHALIDENSASEFLGFSPRHMQGMRYRGGGPRYFALSSRCIRYRRIDLRAWAEARMCGSTSDIAEHERPARRGDRGGDK